jgi:chemotaxis response regulator CheB
MPKAAIDAGAACEVLAIDAMPRVIAARMNA